MGIVASSRRCFGCCSFPPLPLDITRKPGFTDTTLISGISLFIPPSPSILSGSYPVCSLPLLLCSPGSIYSPGTRAQILVPLHLSSNSDPKVDVDSNWCSPVYRGAQQNQWQEILIPLLWIPPFTIFYLAFSHYPHICYFADFVLFTTSVL